MTLDEAEKIIASLGGVFEGNQELQGVLGTFFQYGRGTRLWPSDLPEAAARYRALVEQLPAIVFMAFLDRGIGEAYVSPHIEAALGFSQSEWLDDPVRWYRQIHPEDKERWSREAAAMLVSGASLRSVYRVLARDGRIVWFQCEAKLVRDERGRPWFIHGLAYDVTELKEAQLKLEQAHRQAQERAFALEAANAALTAQIAERERAEKELRRSEERFRLLVDGVKDYAIFMLDPSGRVSSWNQGAQRINGYAADEIIGEHFSKFYLPEEVERGRAEMALRIAASEGRYETDGWRVRKDGSKFWANVVITALRDNADRLYGFVKVTRDMTERKHIQEKLQESERLAAMGATAAVFAHEIGNPLNGISACLQLMQRRLAKSNSDGDAQNKALLRDVLAEVERLSALLNDFRALARPQQMELRPMSMAQIAQELLATEGAHYAERGIVVHQEIPDDLPPVIADGRRLKQALLNLCKNAVEAMPHGGELKLHARCDGEVVCLDVIDTGTGIPENVDIFELFKTTKDDGTGLGLALVRQIVAAHEGTIFYTSQPGRGTTFTISLPVAAPDGEARREAGKRLMVPARG